jgi:hypothetical protein
MIVTFEEEYLRDLYETGKYRIEFTVKNEGVEPVVTVCNILELSNHIAPFIRVKY